jgi:hypothetical protein
MQHSTGPSWASNYDLSKDLSNTRVLQHLTTGLGGHPLAVMAKGTSTATAELRKSEGVEKATTKLI